MSAETDADRQLAIALAEVRASTIIAEGSSQVSSIISAAGSQASAINAEGQGQVQARVGAAQAEQNAIEQIGSAQAEAIIAEGAANANEAVAAATVQATSIKAVSLVEASATKAEGEAQVQSTLGEAAARVSADIQVAQANAALTIQQSQFDVVVIGLEAGAQVQEAIGLAGVHADQTASTSAIEAAELGVVAAFESEATTHAGVASVNATTASAAAAAGGTVAAATTEAGATVYGAQKQHDSALLEADSQSRLTRSGATQDTTANITVATNHASASGYAADDQLAEVKVHEDGTDSRLTTKLDYADEKFNQVFPLAQRALLLGNATSPATIGLMANWPTIPTPEVYSPRLIQIQANLAYNQADQSLASDFRDAQADVSGRGFSSNSPFLDAVRATLVGRALRQSGEGASQARITAAQKNAETILAGQKLRGQAFIDQNNVAVASEGNSVERQVGLVKGVAEMVAGLT